MHLQQTINSVLRTQYSVSLLLFSEYIFFQFFCIVQICIDLHSILHLSLEWIGFSTKWTDLNSNKIQKSSHASHPPQFLPFFLSLIIVIYWYSNGGCTEWLYVYLIVSWPIESYCYYTSIDIEKLFMHSKIQMSRPDIYILHMYI